jgi:hypothetical protein
VENLSGTGNGAFTGTGNALDNQIDGGLGNDTLDGGPATTPCAAASATTAAGRRRRRPLGARHRRQHPDGGAAGDVAVALDDFSAYTVKRPNATDTVLTDASAGEVLTVRNGIEFVNFNGTRWRSGRCNSTLPAWATTTARHRRRRFADGGAAGADTAGRRRWRRYHQIDDSGDTSLKPARQRPA